VLEMNSFSCEARLVFEDCKFVVYTIQIAK
jgi:hypothetical protein